MLKRTMIIALVIVVLSAFCFPVFAADLNMDDVVAENFLPAGYISPQYPFFNNSSVNELWVYDPSLNVYYYITFDGSVCFFDRYDSYYHMKFSNYDSVQVRAYECNGRDIFTFIDDQEINVTIPAGELMRIVPDGNINGKIIDPYQFYELTYFGSEFGGSGFLAPYFDGAEKLEHKVELTMPEMSLILDGLNIPITIDNFAMKHMDYYIVQKNGIGIETSIDFGSTFTFNDGFFCIDGLYSSVIPIACKVVNRWETDWSKINIYFNTGAYYYVSHIDNVYYMKNSQLVNSKIRLPLNILNKFLTHFNYEPLMFNEKEEILKDDLSGVGDELGDMFDESDAIGNAGQSAVNDISGYVNQMSVISTGVWNMLPSWFYACLTVYLIFLVTRKILGR